MSGIAGSGNAAVNKGKAAAAPMELRKSESLEGWWGRGRGTSEENIGEVISNQS